MSDQVSAALAVLRDQYTVRRVRLVCGWVLLSYLVLHFLNHALGNISWQAMEQGAKIAEFIWRGPIGAWALYGALAIHFSLGLWALYQRRHFRIGWGEALRMALGFSIVPLMIHHYVGVRYYWDFLHVHRGYPAVLWVYFTVRPDYGIRQVIVLCVAWTHGCMGMHYWLRLKSGYRRIAPVLLAFAVLLPVLAFLGVMAGAREIREFAAANPDWLKALVSADRLADRQLLVQSLHLEDQLYWLYAAIILLVFMARGIRALVERRRGVVSIAYPSGQTVRIPVGAAVLDASRRAGIPHASVCGGRGRCSTCRVRVLRGFDRLPTASRSESMVLLRLRAGPTVRLACQLRPTEDVAILPLLTPDLTADDRRRRAPIGGDRERFVAILFVDIRQSTALVENRLPYDVIFILNHFFEAVGGAVVTAGGAPNQFIGDGMMAIFGIDCEPREACRQALAAVRGIDQRVEEMNRVLADELGQPIRIGIGLHAGTVILGEIGYRERFLLTAIGDSVHVAARLQDLTKDYGCQIVVSEALGIMAGVDLAAFPRHDIRVRGRDAPLTILVIEKAEALMA